MREMGLLPPEEPVEGETIKYADVAPKEAKITPVEDDRSSQSD